MVDLTTKYAIYQVRDSLAGEDLDLRERRWISDGLKRQVITVRE